MLLPKRGYSARDKLMPKSRCGRKTNPASVFRPQVFSHLPKFINTLVNPGNQSDQALGFTGRYELPLDPVKQGVAKLHFRMRQNFAH